MAAIKKYDIEGNEIEELQIPNEMIEVEYNSQSIKDYLIAIRANRRQWSASTKERAEVSHSNSKPHPQKGTGRARQGTLAAPQYKGGGVVFGPKPKFNQHVKVNRKEKQAAIRYLLSQKIANGTLMVLKIGEMKQPKTKTVANLLAKLSLKSPRVLFLAECVGQAKKDVYYNFTKSMRNIEKTQFKHLEDVNGYDLALNENVLLMEEAFDELTTMLGVE